MESVTGRGEMFSFHMKGVGFNIKLRNEVPHFCEPRSFSPCLDLMVKELPFRELSFYFFLKSLFINSPRTK